MRPWCTIILFAMTIAITGCGGNLPGCSDKEATDLLKGILKKHGVNNIQLSGIATRDKNDNSCNCTAFVKYTMEGETFEETINYEIMLSDNKKEFIVEVKP